MKKKLHAIFALLLIFVLSSCASGQIEQAGAGRVAPFNMSKDTKEFLQIVGMENEVHVFTLTAPDDTAQVTVRIYELRDGTWQEYDHGAIYASAEEFNTKNTYPYFSIIKKDASELRLMIYGAEYKCNLEQDMDTMTGYMYTALDDSMEISINQELPVYIFAGSQSGSMNTISPSDFGSTERFSYYDLAYAVTLTFSDEVAS